MAFDASILLHAKFHKIGKSTNWTEFQQASYIRNSWNFCLSTGCRTVVKVLEMLFWNAIMSISL